MVLLPYLQYHTFDAVLEKLDFVIDDEAQT